MTDRLYDILYSISEELSDGNAQEEDKKRIKNFLLLLKYASKAKKENGIMQPDYDDVINNLDL